MKIETEKKIVSKQVLVYQITLTQEEVNSLIYLLSEVKKDWYSTAETDKILNELLNLKK